MSEILPKLQELKEKIRAYNRLKFESDAINAQYHFERLNNCKYVKILCTAPKVDGPASISGLGFVIPGLIPAFVKWESGHEGNNFDGGAKIVTEFESAYPPNHYTGIHFDWGVQDEAGHVEPLYNTNVADIHFNTANRGPEYYSLENVMKRARAWAQRMGGDLKTE